MAKFKFRLATLLRLREADRDERRGELAEAYQADEIMENQQKELEANLAELSLKCREAVGPGTIDVDRLVDTQRFEILLRAQQQHLIKQRQAVATEIERRRQNLVEANREVHVLEKLKQRQMQRHQEEEGRREIKILDEVAGLRKLREEVSL